MAKKKKGKLPKEVLGVKVPKELRKAGEKLIEQAQGPAGRQAIAGALTAVVGAAATAALARGTRGTDGAAKTSEQKSDSTASSRQPDVGSPGEVIAGMVNAFVSNVSKYNRR